MKEIIEIWKPIKGYEKFYAVSNIGNVKRLKSYTTNHNGQKRVNARLMKLGNCKGYHNVMISHNKSRETRLVHRLVAQAFIENPHSKPHINHINGIRNDNRVENLEWCTPKENEQHKAHVLGNIATPLNLKNVNAVNEPMLINGKYAVGKYIQKFYKDLMSGKRIKASDKSYGKIYSLKYDLVNRFGINVQSERMPGGYKEYWII